jgi:hypothetical protein
MRGCVRRHARSIGANESGSNFGTGWAVGWVVWSSNPCKFLNAGHLQLFQLSARGSRIGRLRKNCSAQKERNGGDY